MFSVSIDNALIKYARDATGLAKAIWAFQNVDQTDTPFVTLEVLGVYNADGHRSENFKKHKWVTIRFNVFTTDETHLIKCSGLLDYADNDNARDNLGDVTFIGALTDVVNATYLEGGFYKERAFIDIRFGMIFEQADPEEYIHRISGQIFDNDFDVTIIPEEEEE